MKRFAVSAGAVVLVLLSLWAWGSCQRAAGARDAELAARDKALADSTAWADLLEVGRAAADSAARVMITVLATKEYHYRQRANRAERRADSLVSMVSDTGLLASLRETLIAERAAKDSALNLSQARADLFFARWLAADSAAQRYRALSESWRAQSETWRRAARPGLLEKGSRALPWMALAIVGWEVAR